MQSKQIKQRKPARPLVKRWIAALAIIAGVGLGVWIWYAAVTAPPPDLWYKQTSNDVIEESIWSDGTAIYTCGSKNTDALDSLVLTKRDVAGNILWQRAWNEGSNHSEGYSVWGDGGAIYAFGLSRLNLVIVKWDAATGTQIWNQTEWHSYQNDFSARSIFGANASIYTCAFFPYIHAAKLAIAKWNGTTGTVLWQREWKGVDATYGCSVWADASFVYTAGYMDNSTTHMHEQVLIKWDTEGNQLWNRTWGRVNDQTMDLESSGVSVWGDVTGNSYTLGSTITPSTSQSNKTDMMLVKWDAGGDQIWNRTWGGNLNEFGESIWGNGTDIYTAGSLSPWSRMTMILVRWNNNGNQQWNQTWGSDRSPSYGRSIWGYGTSLYSCADHYIIRWDAVTGATQHIIDIDWVFVFIVYGSIVGVTIVVLVGGPAIERAIKKPRKRKTKEVLPKCPRCGYVCQPGWTECPICNTSLGKQ
nr:zinc ribbon domain-containing protein [Candidatus Sigynarchaeota archaeon]